MNRAVPVRPERYNWKRRVHLGDEIPDIADLNHSRSAPRSWDPTLVQNTKRSGKVSGPRGTVTLAWIENGDPSLGTPHDLALRNIGALPPEPAALSNDLENGGRLAVPYG